jgi:hypothetical protein
MTDMIERKSDPYNAEPTPSALIERFLTPQALFYVRSHASAGSARQSSDRGERDGHGEPLFLGRGTESYVFHALGDSRAPMRG